MKREGTTLPLTLAEGRYSIERQLGAGGMGTVWLARDTKLAGRLVAVKLLRAELASGTCLARFRREAKIMARLDHPGLVRIYDVRLEGPEPFLVQDFVEGEDLTSVLARRQTLTPAEVARLAREMADALACIHAQGIVHRDLKPSNIMMQPDGRFRLTDLGLALAQDSTRLTRDEAMLGTLLYMAPETVLGVEQGTAVDVYALGLTLYEAATGRHPHAGHLTVNEYMQRLVANRFAAPPPVPGLEPILARTIVACMQPDPDCRPVDGAAVLRLLDDDDSSALPPVQAPSRALSTGRRTRTRRPAVVLAVALFLALAFFLVLRREPSASPSLSAMPARAPSELPPPRVLCLLDGLRLQLPAPPPEGTTARLTTMDGELLVERPVRGDAVTLHPPEAIAGPVRWSLSGPDGEGTSVAAVGPRVLIGPPKRSPPDQRGGRSLTAPPLAVGGRLLVPVNTASVEVFRPRRRPGEPLALIPEGSRRPAPKTGRLSALVDRGGGTLLGLTRGYPCGILHLPPDPNAPVGHEPIVDLSGDDALGASLPGGGAAVAALTGRPFEGTAADRITLAFWPPPPETRMRAVLHRPGSSLLALQAMDADTALVAFVDGRRGLASVVRCVGTTATVLGTVEVPPPAPREEPGIPAYPGLTLPDGGAALALDGTLVLAGSDGSLRLLPLGLPPLARTAAVLAGPDGSVVLLAALLPASPFLIPVDLHPLVVDPSRGVVGLPGPPVLRVNRRIERLLPLATAPLPGGELLLASGGVLAVLAPPPGLVPRLMHDLPGEDPCAALVLDGSAFLVDREGRVLGFDLEGR